MVTELVNLGVGEEDSRGWRVRFILSNSDGMVCKEEFCRSFSLTEYIHTRKWVEDSSFSSNCSSLSM